MKKLIKTVFILTWLVVAVIVLSQTLNLGLVENPIFLVGLALIVAIVLISTMRKISKNAKKKVRTSSAASASRSATVDNSDALELYKIAELYSRWYDLKDYAKAEISVSYDSDQRAFTISYSLDVENCGEDANMNDIKASLRYWIDQVAKGVKKDASRAANGRFSIHTPTVY